MKNNISSSFENSSISFNIDFISNTSIMSFFEMFLKNLTFEIQNTNLQYHQSSITSNVSFFEIFYENTTWSNQNTNFQWNQSLFDSIISISTFEMTYDDTTLSSQNINFEWNQFLFNSNIVIFEMFFENKTLLNHDIRFEWNTFFMSIMSTFEMFYQNIILSNQNINFEWNIFFNIFVISTFEMFYQHTTLSNQNVNFKWNTFFNIFVMSTFKMFYQNTILLNQNVNFKWNTSFNTFVMSISKMIYQNTILSNQNVNFEWNIFSIVSIISIFEMSFENFILSNQKTSFSLNSTSMYSMLNSSFLLSNSFTINFNVYQFDVLNVSNCNSSICWHFATTSLNLNFFFEKITLFYLFVDTQCIIVSFFFVMNFDLTQNYFINYENSNVLNEQNFVNNNNFLFEFESKQNNISKYSISINSQNQSFCSFDDSQSIKKRKRFFQTIDRMLRARICSLISKYEMKISRIKFDQQKIIEWLSETTKRQFDKIYESFMKKWKNVEFIYTKTCVLCSKKWRNFSSNDLILLNIINVNQLFIDEFSRLTYQYSNHVIFFARIVAWFKNESWSRSIEWINNFIKCEFFESINVSHLCHQKHCIIHSYYENVKINHERKFCANWAKNARQKKRMFRYVVLNMNFHVFCKWVCICQIKQSFDYWHIFSMLFWIFQKHF